MYLVLTITSQDEQMVEAPGLQDLPSATARMVVQAAWTAGAGAMATFAWRRVVTR